MASVFITPTFVLKEFFRQTLLQLEPGRRWRVRKRFTTQTQFLNIDCIAPKGYHEMDPTDLSIKYLRPLAYRLAPQIAPYRAAYRFPPLAPHPGATVCEVTDPVSRLQVRLIEQYDVRLQEQIWTFRTIVG